MSLSYADNLDRHYGRNLDKPASTTLSAEPLAKPDPDAHGGSYHGSSSSSSVNYDMNASVSSEHAPAQPRPTRYLIQKPDDYLDLIDPDWGKRYVHAQSRLYILIESIDGESLRSPASTQVLSMLASCNSVSLIATADTLNTGLLWNTAQLSAFRWSYVHTPTFDSHDVQDSFFGSSSELKMTEGTELQSSDMNESDKTSLHHIIENLTSRHIDLLKLLVKALNAAVTKSASDKPITSLSSETLFKAGEAQMLVKTKSGLSLLLTELIDHAILAVGPDGNGVERVRLIPPIDVLCDILQMGKT